ncbi:MAG TPA: hypothetical protein VMR45_01205, partial [Patescibacteria group bacterium]|nr:hypothetical protein [Patescibacteria group bacterium]
MGRFLQKHLRAVAASIIILILVGALAVCGRMRHMAWIDAHPLSDPRVGFQFLYPAKLPTGFSIKTKRIYIHHSKPHTLRDAAVVMSLRTQDAVYSIQEWRATDEDIYTNLHNFDPESKYPTCMEEVSSKGQQYRLCHWLDYEKISVYEVKLIKQGVLIEATFPT